MDYVSYMKFNFWHRIVSFSIGCWLFSEISVSTFAGPETPYGRASVSVVEPDAGSEKETPLEKDSRPGKDKKLQVYFEANQECAVAIAAFNRKDGGLVNGWLPAFTISPEWDERKVPALPITWNWNADTPTLDIYVVFIDKKSPSSNEFQTLITAMQNPKADPKLLRMQASKLQEMMGKWLSSKSSIQASATESRPTIGGVVRGGDFDWRSSAKKAEFKEKEPGVLVFNAGS
jgi:hypothetical protein